MANEAVTIEWNGNAIRRTCIDATNISKATLLCLSGSNAVWATTLQTTRKGDPFGGIATMAKVSGDGSTSISATMEGVFDLYTDSIIPCGSAVVLSGANRIDLAVEADFPTGAIVGYTEELTAAGANRVRLRGI